MHARAVVMFGVKTVVEPNPVVNAAVAAHAPGHRLVGVAAEMFVIAVEHGEAVAGIVEEKEVNHELPVEEESDDCEGDAEKYFKHAPPRLAWAESADFAVGLHYVFP